MDNKDILEKYSNIILNELVTCIDDLDLLKLNKAKEIIMASSLNGGRLHITGIGKPSHIASYIASLFSSIGTPTYFLDATECVHGSAGQTKPGDVVIVISNSGETQELKSTIKALKNIDIHLIAVTGNENSTLSKESEVTLKASVKLEGDNLNKPPRASIITELYILTSLSLLLQNEKNITLNEYLKWHPGGTIGESIIRKE